MISHNITGGKRRTELHVVEGGKPAGRPILFIHGVSQCSLTWRRQIDSELAEEHRLLAMDMRGHDSMGK
jgi:non-heme chloroperoxidase